MHQIRFRWGSAPDPAGGAYSIPPDRLAVFMGAYFWGEGGQRGTGREGKGGGERPYACPVENCWLRHWTPDMIVCLCVCVSQATLPYTTRLAVDTRMWCMSLPRPGHTLKITTRTDTHLSWKPPVPASSASLKYSFRPELASILILMSSRRVRWHSPATKVNRLR